MSSADVQQTKTLTSCSLLSFPYHVVSVTHFQFLKILIIGWFSVDL